MNPDKLYSETYLYLTCAIGICSGMAIGVLVVILALGGL